MGVLAGIEDATGFDRANARPSSGRPGPIVSAHLVAGQSPRRPSNIDNSSLRRRGSESVDACVGCAVAAKRAGAFAMAAGAFAPCAVAAPGGAVMRAAMLRRIPTQEDLSRLRNRIERLARASTAACA